MCYGMLLEVDERFCFPRVAVRLCALVLPRIHNHALGGSTRPAVIWRMTCGVEIRMYVWCIHACRNG
jgi:hypothetical protein